MAYIVTWRRGLFLGYSLTRCSSRSDVAVGLFYRFLRQIDPVKFIKGNVEIRGAIIDSLLEVDVYAVVLLLRLTILRLRCIYLPLDFDLPTRNTLLKAWVAVL